MSVKKLLNLIDFGDFPIDFLSEKSMMETVLLGLEAGYEICN